MRHRTDLRIGCANGYKCESRMSYQPKPVDTSQIPLPAELEPLVERLAENVHEQWAALRIAQGWKYGPERDDSQKLHPCLVPYDDLPDSEKDYDRQSVRETVRVICQLGYRIVKAGD